MSRSHKTPCANCIRLRWLFLALFVLIVIWIATIKFL